MALSRLLAAGLAVALVSGVAFAQDARRFEVSITVDDLVTQGALPPGTTRQQVADNFLAAFKAHGVREAWGFINGKSLEADPSAISVLEAWRAAGYPLGNHGYGHLNASQNPVEAVKADIDGNEPVLSSLMGNEDWHWLRFPNLSAGTDTTHDEIMQYVKSKGYKIADVTMNFNDWAYTDAYARCVSKGDKAAIAALREKYMGDVVVAVRRSRTLSQKIYGRDIPYVLLVHIGAFTGEMMPRILAALEAEGAVYVSLDEAQRDPAYDFGGPGAAQGIMLERVAQERGININDGSIASLADVGSIMAMCQ